MICFARLGGIFPVRSPRFGLLLEESKRTPSEWWQRKNLTCHRPCPNLSPATTSLPVMSHSAPQFDTSDAAQKSRVLVPEWPFSKKTKQNYLCQLFADVLQGWADIQNSFIFFSFLLKKFSYLIDKEIERDRELHWFTWQMSRSLGQMTIPISSF